MDYYTNTVFEITSKENKSQNALVGGGRYNGLIEQLGGPSTPGTGFGMGVERVINEIIESNININEKINSKILFTSIDKNSYDKKIKYNLIARNNNINSEISTEGKSLKATMRYANNNNFSIVIILGQDPNGNNNTVSIKYLESGKQENISENELLTMLNKNNNE